MSGPLAPLTPPDPVGPLQTERAAGLVPIDEEERAEAARRAEEFTALLGELDPHAPEFGAAVRELLSGGEKDLKAAAYAAARLLSTSTIDAGTERGITTGLAELRRTVARLDPGDRGLLARLGRGSPARKLVRRYQEEREPVDALARELRTGQDRLRRTNASIAGERKRMWKTMGDLARACVLAEAITDAVTAQAGVLDLVDPLRATTLRSDVLHPVMAHHQGMLAQLAVCAQGYLALELVRRTNDELIRGVEHAVSTMVSALGVAVNLALALAQQKEVRGAVSEVGGITERLITGNAAQLADHMARLPGVAGDPVVSVATIRAAFDEIINTVDAVDRFRAEATHAMAVTNAELAGEVRRVGEALQRSQEFGLAEGES